MTYDGTSVYSGMLASLGIRAETTYGSRGSGSTYDLRSSKGTIKTMNMLTPKGGIRDSRVSQGSQLIRTHYEGSIEGAIVNPVPFIYAFGKVTDGGSYTHTIVPTRAATGGSETYLKSFTLEGTYEKPDTSSDVMLSALGCTVKSATFRFPVNAEATYTLNYVAKSA